MRTASDHTLKRSVQVQKVQIAKDAEFQECSFFDGVFHDQEKKTISIRIMYVSSASNVWNDIIEKFDSQVWTEHVIIPLLKQPSHFQSQIGVKL